MLRAVLYRRPLPTQGLFRPIARAQWLDATGIPGARAQRFYADEKGSERTVFPGSASQTAPGGVAPPPAKTETPATPSTTTIPPANVPKTPPPPQQVQQTAPPTSIPPSSTGAKGPTPPPPPPPPKTRKPRRFRRLFLLTLTTLGLAYGGAVYYALISDSFHEFFTEYVPYGEDVVLFFEERQFKKRFPNGVPAGGSAPLSTAAENKVTISGKSGASARVSGKQTPDMGTGGNHASAVDASKESTGKNSKSDSVKEKPSVEKAKQAAASSSSSSKTAVKSSESKAETKTSSDKKAAEPPKKEQKEKKDAATAKSEPAPAKTEPAGSSSAAPIPLIESTVVENASDPVVQKVSKMLNDVITVVNADNASGKYSSAISKAKDDLKSLAAELETYRTSESKAAEDKIKQTESEFDQAARNIVSRFQEEQREQEIRWREEYEAERERVSNAYEQRLQTELQAAAALADQKLRNELLQQHISLQEYFASSVRDHVEQERNARLSKLSQLSTAVSELETLTGQWNEVVDANLRTQHLVVAVDAVRAALEATDRPRPFVAELAALREVAAGDGVIDAAIASIHPSAYQRGVPTAAQLVDRFRRVAAEVRKAALLPEDAGVASHAASFFLSKFMFKKQGLATGEDVESVLTRTELLLEEGELDEAAREMNALTGWAKVLSQDWLRDCRIVLEVRQALEVMATEARLQSLLVE